jgi:pyruvate formate lyase activating enzyme
MFFDGGGVTFTGCEVSLQLPQVEKLLQLLKAENINTCIETNGTNIKLPVLYPFLDRLIIDFKSGNAKKLLEVNEEDIVMSYKDKTRIKKVSIKFENISKAHLAIKF